MAFKWIKLLKSRGVYINPKRGLQRQQRLLMCLEEETFIPIPQIIEIPEPHEVGATATESVAQTHDMANENLVERTTIATAPTSATQQEFFEAQIGAATQAHPDVLHENGANVNSNQNKHGIADQINEDVNGMINQQNQIFETQRYTRRVRFARPILQNHHVTPGVESVSYEEGRGKPIGVQGIIQAFKGRKKFSGGFDEDLNSILLIFESMSRMCRLTEEQKAEGFPTILEDDALQFYLTHCDASTHTYIEIVRKFRENYITAEQMNRVLTAWQTTRISKEMSENPDKSELEVFRKMVAKLSKLQRQLDSAYQGDLFLRDQIVVATDMPRVQQ